MLAVFLCISIILPAAKTVHGAGLIDNEQDLSSGTDWGTLYGISTGGSGSGTHFGAYVFEPIGSNLYIGLASARPAEENGALLVRWNGSTATAAGQLDEQGVQAMVTAQNDSLIIAGTDPTDDWTFGNVYSYNGSTLTKHRSTSGLSNVFHKWSVTKDDDGTLFSAASAHDGSQPNPCVVGTSCFGEIYKSTNNGQSWTRTSILGDYRAYGIQVANDKLYALSVDNSNLFSDLWVSSDLGVNWTALTSESERVITRTRPVAHNGELVVVAGASDANKLYSVDANNAITTHSLSFSIGATYSEAYYSNHNQMISVEGYLYVITRDGGVKRSYDLDNWETVSESSNTYLSIGYWPHENWLLLGEKGNGARIRYIDLDSFTSTTVTGLDNSLDIKDANTDRDLTSGSPFNYGTHKKVRLLTNDGLVISEVTTDLSSNSNWGGVAGDSNSTSGKAFVRDLDSVAGNADTHTLYIPIPSGSDGTDVVICPSAESLADVSAICTSGVRFQEGETETVGSEEVTVTKVTIGSQEYWKAEGVSGTGGLDTTPDVTAPSATTITTDSSLTQKISWTTDEASTTQIQYGLTDSMGTYTTQTNVSPRVTSHTVILRGLSLCTLYYYKVYSIDITGNTYSSGIQSFTSYGC